MIIFELFQLNPLEIYLILLDPFKDSVFCLGFTGHDTELNVLWLPILIFNNSESITVCPIFVAQVYLRGTPEGGERNRNPISRFLAKGQPLLEISKVSGGEIDWSLGSHMVTGPEYIWTPSVSLLFWHLNRTVCMLCLQLDFGGCGCRGNLCVGVSRKAKPKASRQGIPTFSSFLSVAKFW